MNTDADGVRTLMKRKVWRGIIEVTFIIFLFYSNLLMGEFERSGGAQGRGLAWAIRDTVTTTNVMIAIVAAFVGYVVVEFLRNRLL